MPAADNNKAYGQPTVEEIRKQYKLATTSPQYQEQLEDFRTSIRNYDGDQWDKESVAAMKDAKPVPRVPLTINQVAPPVHQVVNDQRQNRPAVKISPVDSGADKETAEVFAGAIRHIEYRSKADAAYDTAFEYAAAGGFGYWGITTEYANDEDAWDLSQELLIRRFPDPEAIRPDPNSREVDGSDYEFCFVDAWYSREAFQRQWPDAEMSGGGFLSSDHPELDDWLTEDSVRVCEYWYIRHQRRRALWLDGGMDENGRPTVIKAFADEFDETPPKELIIREREYDERSVHMCLTNGHEVLEHKDWAGRWIPVIPCYGKEIYVGGKRKLRSMIWNSLDSQKLLNGAVTSAWETAKLAPKVPYIGAVGQFASDAKNWAMAALGQVPFLQYDVKEVGGTPLPPPQRNSFEPAIQALSFLSDLAGRFIKSTTGIFSASLGEEDATEKSGRALLALQKEGDMANFHLSDNLSRSIAHSGRMLVDLIPKIYDTERLIRIIGEDGKETVERVGANIGLDMQRDAGVLAQLNLTPDDDLRSAYIALGDKEREQYRKQHGFQIDVGHYDVVASSGPSYDTKRQQSADQMLELAKLFPGQMANALDVLVGALDLVQADEIKKRVTPPQFADDGEQEIPPAVRAEVDQLQNAFEDAMKKIEELTAEKQAKVVDNEAAMERERLKAQKEIEIAESKNRLEYWKALLEDGTENSIALLRAETQRASDILDVRAAEASNRRTQDTEREPVAPGAQN